jgi:hypothetical protein
VVQSRKNTVKDSFLLDWKEGYLNLSMAEFCGLMSFLPKYIGIIFANSGIHKYLTNKGKISI